MTTMLTPEQVQEKIAHWKPDAQAALFDQLKAARGWKPFYCPNRRCTGFPHVIAYPDPTTPCEQSTPFAPDHMWEQPRDPNDATLSPADRRLARRQRAGEAAVRCLHEECDVVGYAAKPDEWMHYHARSDQHPPPWGEDWLTWLVRSGRGTGKTYGATNLVNKVVHRVPILTLIGVTGPTMRRDMIEGPSGVIATAPPDNRPLWEPSKQQLTWPNGAVGHCVSAEEPDRLRGMNSGFIWLDEPAHMGSIDEVWDQALLTLRDATYATKVLATTTPLPTPWVNKVNDATDTRVTVVSTYKNLHTLSPTFRKQVLDKYENTHLGDQELHGQVLTVSSGTLWDTTMFVHAPSDVDLPEFERVGTGLDPAGSVNPKSDETGIITGGVARAEDHPLTADHPMGPDTAIYWVLGDATGKYKPGVWAKKTDEQNEEHLGDVIFAERNYGGDMVKHVLETANIHARVQEVNSRKGKKIRAEPVVGLYEQGRVVHVRGLSDMEAEQTTWVPGIGRSPNRVDALVHLITGLHKTYGPSEIASPYEINL